MKTPSAALVRARARAPLPTLQALHLSHADLTSLRHLEGCRHLRSLYANGNVLKDIDALAALRRLWRVELSDNALARQLKPFAGFPALGFLNLERNQLRLEDLVSLRNVHILELKVAGNRALEANDVVQSRMKIVALLPYVWSLDGHFVTTHERAEAVEAYDSLVLQLLNRRNEGDGGGESSLHFGLTSELWGDAPLRLDDDCTVPVHEDALKLLQLIDKQPTRQPGRQDLYRLRALAMFHDSESDVHNAHVHFAPNKHAATAKSMPKISINNFLALKARARLELCVLLLTHLDFALPAKLLAEALTIAILSGQDETHGSWIDDLTQLPPYAVVALVSALRAHLLDENDAAQRNRSKSSPAVMSAMDLQLWKSMPAVATTLLSSERQRRLVEANTPDQWYVQRCSFAVSLLSRASTFPAKTKANRAMDGLTELIDAAKLASVSAMDSFGFAIPSVLVYDPDDHPIARSKSIKHPEREYRKPWSEKRTSTQAPTHVAETSINSQIQRWRPPKPGERLELAAKCFLKICSLSADGHFLSAAVSTDATGIVTLRIDQVARISSTTWRLATEDPMVLHECLFLLGLEKASTNGRLGKLHRDSEGFHKHGAARNQGYPNRDVSAQDLTRIRLSESSMSSVSALQPQPVEVFSSTDSLDSNYVLASPALISVQNAVATRAFHDQRRISAGLWNPIQTAPFSVLSTSDTSTLRTNVTETQPKIPKVKTKRAKAPGQPEDDWLGLKRDMQTLLGIHPTSEGLADSSGDAEYFMTSVPNGPGHDKTEHRTGVADQPTSSPRLSHSASSPLMTCASSPASSISRSTAKPKRLVALSWHQVATKPQLLVASNFVVSSPLHPKTNETSGNPSGPFASASAIDEPAKTEPMPTSRPWSSSSRQTLRLTRCQVSLPTLSLSSPSQN